ncbi:MAG: M61 family metallopeptidase [Acidobacteria bacterium]|nr:M61 family metallopeptidase [Acidobacteriota bacterium]
MRGSLLCGRLFALVLAMGIALADGLYAQNSAGPQPVPLPPPIPAPGDKPYMGTISLSVDLSNVQARVVSVREVIPVKAGELTLLYPKWLPGTHSPSNLVADLAGLGVTADGQRVSWVRDSTDMWAFHIQVPNGATTLQVSFQYLAPTKAKEGRISNQIADLTWNSVLLYPAGYFARQIQFSPQLRLPEGWKFATALEVKTEQRNLIQFKDTALNTLVDSPVYAGINYKRVDLSSGPKNPVFLNIFADKPIQLEISPEQLQYHKNLVVQAERLFDSHHYDHYDFLLSVSDTVGSKGLEHHQSSEDGTRANYFTDWPSGIAGRALLPHEYTHSWNGKFRRPAELWTPNFNVPMQNSLLWVYEGLTDYYGNVLTARSGMRTLEQARDQLAEIAANLRISPGRTWRPLADTTNQPIISSHGISQEIWPSWQRSYDYYWESDLVWLDADTKIRELSQEQRSLDDFAKLFFGSENGSYTTKTYTLEDLVKALNSVQPLDWGAFFRSRIYDVEANMPEDGLTRGGYRLVYNDTEPDAMKHRDKSRGASFATSLGLSLKPEANDDDNDGATGGVANVWWDSPAFKAGLTPEMQVKAVNDQAFTVVNLRDAILAAENSSTPIKLLVKRDQDFLTLNVNFHEGLRYPHLERIESTPNRLDAILEPRK